MNPNGLVRPPTINASPASHGSSTASSNANAAEGINLNTLTEQITRIVSEVLNREGRHIIDRILNPSTDINNDVDQTIDTSTDRNLADLDRIPDIVKSLREFSGQPGEFSSWKKSVDRILAIYEHLRGTPKYYGILSVIRNKIVGHADIALESYNTPLNWGKISKCLTLHYADKRDLGTLEYQMTTLIQGHRSIQEFYQEVYQHLSLILNKLSCMDMSNESLNNMTQSYRDKALDTFVRGLKGDLPRLLSIKEPVDLPQALHLCLKLQNVDYRTQYANNNQTTMRRAQPPPPLSRNNTLHRSVMPIPPPRRHFFPELLNNPQRPPRPNFQGAGQTQFPRYPHQLPPRPQPRPEPMDIDRSIHSRQVNYANRPQNQHFAQKRNYPSQSNRIHQPNKHQRVYYTEQTAETEQDFSNKDGGQDEQTPPESVENPDSDDLDQPEDLDDIYFLD